MADLTFASDIAPQHSHPIKLDTKEILAVVNLGFNAQHDGTFAHRRVVYTADDLVTVWERTKTKDTPPSIRSLDNLGGKPYVQVGKPSSHGLTNQSDLNTANTLRVSVALEDLHLIKSKDTHGSTLAAGTTVNGSFTASAQGQTLPPKTMMYYADLRIGANKVPAAHLDAARFSKFELIKE